MIIGITGLDKDVLVAANYLVAEHGFAKETLPGVVDSNAKILAERHAHMASGPVLARMRHMAESGTCTEALRPMVTPELYLRVLSGALELRYGPLRENRERVVITNVSCTYHFDAIRRAGGIVLHIHSGGEPFNNGRGGQNMDVCIKHSTSESESDLRRKIDDVYATLLVSMAFP